MKNPTRKRADRHFRAGSTECLTERCSHDADSFLHRINGSFPGLTCRRTFDVISFANRLLFCIGKGERFFGMKLNDEFYFATAKQIYRIMVSPQAKKS